MLFHFPLSYFHIMCDYPHTIFNGPITMYYYYNKLIANQCKYFLRKQILSLGIVLFSATDFCYVSVSRCSLSMLVN